MKVENLEKIKKGTKLMVNNGLGLCSAVSLESIVQGRGFKKTLLVDFKGSEVGLYDECGSIYINHIRQVLLD